MYGKKVITILGATGSIGLQTLEVLETLKSEYEIGFLTVNSNIELLSELINKYNPMGVAICNEQACRDFLKQTNFKGIVLTGDEGIIQAASDKNNDMVLSALVGFSGVRPTLSAINAGITIALANKETLVSAGSIITEAAKTNNVRILAVDSENSAIAQCLIGERHDSIEKIILTASGGPFWNTSQGDFKNLTVSQALAHPNWSMGSKITIDSSTMMNKGFEVIEAYWLFGVEAERIDVLIHPQSIVHSLVQFADGSVKAQLGLPDMKLPIIFALGYPDRRKTVFPRLDLSQSGSLSFFRPDNEKFPCLGLAYRALESGGTAPAVLNAANEIAVQAFISGSISYIDIPRCIETAMEKIELKKSPEIEDILYYDKLSRVYTLEYVKKIRN